MRNNEDRLGANIQRQDPLVPVQNIVSQNSEEGISQKPFSLDFIVPTDFVALPTKGKFYPVNHPLHNKEAVEIKQMTAKEEDILTSRTLLKKGVALDRLITSLIVDKNVNSDSIIIQDRNAIIISARISAYGPEYITQVNCPSCNEKVKNNFNLVEKLEEETTQELTEMVIDSRGYFNVYLPQTKWNVTCRAMNGYDEKHFVRVLENKKEGADAIITEQIRAMIVAVEGREDKELLDKVANFLPAGDARYLRREYKKVVPDFELKKKFSCSACSYETVMEVPLTADFFWSR